MALTLQQQRRCSGHITMALAAIRFQSQFPTFRRVDNLLVRTSIWRTYNFGMEYMLIYLIQRWWLSLSAGESPLIPPPPQQHSGSRRYYSAAMLPPSSPIKEREVPLP